MASSSGNDRSDSPMAAKDLDPWESPSLFHYESAGNQYRWGCWWKREDDDDSDENSLPSLPDPPEQPSDVDSWEKLLDLSPKAAENRFASLRDPTTQALVDDQTEWETWTEPPVLPSTDGESELAIYKTKLINFLGRSTPIILQNQNGPCPLIAICNVLVLRGAMDLGKFAFDVTHEDLVSLLAGRIMESSSNVEGKDEVFVRQQEQDIMDALDIVPNLVKGLDVNVKFRRINDFECTRECAIFDVLNIGLCHGWIVDPQESDTVEAIGSDSYNTLVDKVVDFEMGKIDEEDKEAFDIEKLEQSMSLPASLDNIKETPCPGSVSSSEKPVAQVSDQDDKSHQPEVDCSLIPMVQQKGQLIKHFLENSASQLTYYGLFCLQEGLKEQELCVFFRNNHFSTMFKHKGELYVLATDQGYIDKPELVWEKLNEINGNTFFVNAKFEEYKDEIQINHSGAEQSSKTSNMDYLTTFGDSSPSTSSLSYLDALEHHKPVHQRSKHHKPVHQRSKHHKPVHQRSNQLRWFK